MVSTKPLIGTTIFNTDNPNPRKGREGKGEEHRGMEMSTERRTGEKRNGCKFYKSIGGGKSLGSNVLHVKDLLWSRATESMV